MVPFMAIQAANRYSMVWRRRLLCDIWRGSCTKHERRMFTLEAELMKVEQTEV